MTDDDPITLDEACRLYSGASYKVATLKAAAEAGRLDIFLLGRRYHTTKAAMREWVRQCQENGRRRDCTSIRRENSGSSETVQRLSAQAAAQQTVEALKRLSKNTSGTSTGRSRAQTR